MSFGGGFSGFGSNNNNQSSGFGGFGANNNNNSNTSGGFGSNTNTGAGMFGQNSSTTGSNMFGSTANTSSPFGGGGAFGANSAPKTTFGSTPFGGGGGGGLFSNAGASSSGSAFGGGAFGSTNNTTSTPAFGASANAGGSLFGQNKPTTGFGASTTGGSGIFGGGSTGGFGATNTNTAGGFGASTGGFGAGAAATQNTGTANTPFQAFTEKDGTTGNAQSHYQTITFQQPYQNFSLEELRVVDYNQGRRYGNQNGQAGAFGQSTGFGGFANTNNNATATTGFGANTNTGGNLFGGGNTSNTTSAFGQNTGSAFGANNNTAGGSLFGQAKPATGGLFGAANTTPASGAVGLFGSASNTNTTGAFGSGGGGFGAAANNGGSLFGQAKPAATGGLFGGPGAATNTSTAPFGGSTTTGAFGQSNAGGGLFGQQNNNTSTTGAFGANNTTANTGGGLFGGGASTGAFGQNNQIQQPAQATVGLFGGGSAFGQNNQQNQPKPGGLFGGTTTTPAAGGGGLFGQANTQAQPSGGLFGSSTTANNNAGGSLFGQKPAAATGGLFGGSTAGNALQPGGGLFGGLGGQNNNQPSTGSGLFGSQNNQQKPGSLFGGNASNANTGGGLFGNLGQNNNQQSNLGGSLFQSQNQQPQQQANNNSNNSLFGASGSSLLNTSMNTNPYGNDALFAGLATPTQSPGPIATPLSSSQKNKRSAVLPQHKLNPAASTRLLTPQNKRPGGYGFSYSTYGTPASGQSTNGTGFAGSLFTGSRALSKSMSTSNLRNSFNPETSILAPGAFSTNGRNFGNGSLKKLNVNRSINTRIPLFDEPSQKRVSFAAGDINGEANGETALIVHEEEENASPKAANGDASRDASGQQTKQTSGSDPSRGQEKDVLSPKLPASVNAQNGDSSKPGDYWSTPSIAQLKKMSRQELQSVSNFTVGRHNAGQITFHCGKPVDLSDVNLDKLFGDIVQLTTRNAAVYGETCTCLPKPSLGSALNQPSEIVLANSGPRGKAGKKDVKHLERLKRVNGTTFVSFNQTNGDWTFIVPHFSSYGLNDEDYSDDEDESSFLSDAPDTPAQPQQHRSSQMTSTPQEESFVSPQSQSSPDDTFDFKKGMRSRSSVPGGFGDETVYDDESATEDSQSHSFLGQRSVGSLDGQQDADYTEESESESGHDQDMADSVSGPIHTTELIPTRDDPFRETLKPKSILKASQVLRSGMGTPAKAKPVFDDDWANQLQRTISPRKQDRQFLRESQGTALKEQDLNVSQFAQTFGGGRQMTNAMDLMDSLFGETHKQSVPKRGGHGIELPYPKRPKTASDLDQLNGTDKDFHNCSKPSFSQSNILIYGNKGPAHLEGGIFATSQEPLVGATKDIRFMKMPTFEDSAPGTLFLQKQHTKIFTSDGVPAARLQIDPAPIEFSDMAKAVAVDNQAGLHEQQAWSLLSLLYDDADKTPEGVKSEHLETYKKERLSEFWKQLVWDDAQEHASQAASQEERAIAYLSCNDIADACHALLDGLDLRLATMVAQIGGDYSMRQSMTTQIEEWRRLDLLSEMEDPHRALYELISGNCAQAEGKLGAGRENKASTFGISGRFALDWRRAFGLRLWYGIMADEPIEMAIAQFADAMSDGKEDVKPVPWFVRDGSDMGWRDAKAENREDLLWGILKLYAASRMELAANIEDVIAPENVSGHPLNARLSFQLFQLFRSRQDDERESDERKVDMPTVRGDSEQGHRNSFLSSTASPGGKDSQAKDPLTELSDKITLTYASSLHTAEHWTTAIWVYTHLSSPATREHYIRSLLNQYASTYALEDSDTTYTYLTRDFCVPTTWIHGAAALQAKSDGDSLREATHLIKADELEEAHEVLCRKVGPDAIISRDYDPLRELMNGFIPPSSGTPNSSSRVSSARRSESVPGWAQGGQIYFDYIELLDSTNQQSTHRRDPGLELQIHQLLTKLQGALETAGRDRLASCGLEERIALMEIAGFVAGLLAKNPSWSRGAILKLPLTEDQWLKHSCELSTHYYRSVMASGR